MELILRELLLVKKLYCNKEIPTSLMPHQFATGYLDSGIDIQDIISKWLILIDI